MALYNGMRRPTIYYTKNPTIYSVEVLRAKRASIYKNPVLVNHNFVIQ